LHPGICFVLCYLLNVPEMLSRSAVLMAAMAPGVNAYLISSMYRRGQGVAASTVLMGTALSVLSVSAWLWVLS